MKKKATSWLLIMALVITMIPATVATVHAASGTFEGVKYSINNGVLTIEKGTASRNWPAGSMGDGLISPSWKNYSNDVKKVVIKDGVTDISNEAFSNMTNLTEVDIAESVKQIGNSAFAGDSALTNVNFGNSVVKIGSCAFQYCSALAEVDLPTSIRWVGSNAFTGTAIVNAQNPENFIVVDTVLVDGGSDFNKDQTCAIPSGITCIADNAFQDIEIKSALVFPDSLLYIGNYAFDGGNYSNSDKPLTELNLNNVVQVGNGAFRYWTKIKSVDLSKVTYIGDYAFCWCSNLESMTFAKRMEHLGEYIIQESNMVSFVNSEPEYIERVYGYAFEGNSAFGNDIYHDADDDGLIYYKNILMTVDTTVNELTIADGTYNIASRAFEWFEPSDTTKVSVTIPESVTSIGYSFTFGRITDIYYGGSMNQWNAINFEKAGCFTNATIHCAKSDDEDIPASCSHTWGSGVATTKATFDKAGVKTFTCAKCGATKTESIAAAKTPTLSPSTYTYNATVKKPAVNVVNTNGTVLAKSVTYPPGRINVGTYKVTVKLTGDDYTGTKDVKFKINPAKPTNVKLTAKKKQLKVSWKKPSTAYRNQIDGYQIRYATSKSGLTKGKVVKVSGKTAVSKTIKSLKSKKTYYVQVRTYNKIGSTTYYSGWTTSKSAKVK